MLIRIACPLILLSLLLSACGKREPELRRYTEVIQIPKRLSAPRSDAAAGASGVQSAPAPDLTWELPQGWREGQNSGPRLATLVLDGDESGAFCSISIFGGGGSVEANVQRWAGQIGLPQNAEVALIDLETPIGEMTLVDFVQASGTAGTTSSMLAAIAPLDGGRTLFLKFTGPTELLAEQRQAFLKLCASVSRNAGSEEG